MQFQRSSIRAACAASRSSKLTISRLSSCDGLGKLRFARDHGLALRDEIFVTLPLSGERKANLV